LSTFPATCSVRRQAKHRDVLLKQSADGLAQWADAAKIRTSAVLDLATITHPRRAPFLDRIALGFPKSRPAVVRRRRL
jgi:hypothetical protein